MGGLNCNNGLLRKFMMIMVIIVVLCLSSSLQEVKCDNDDILSSGSVRSVHIHSSSLSAAAAAAGAKKHILSGIQLASSTSIASSLVVMVPTTTAGPYPEDISDYVNTRDLISLARAGASGVTSDRTSITTATRFNITLNIYGVSGTTATPLTGATVYIWHCDALGIYSSVALSSAPTNIEDTTGQYWARGYQITNSSGSVTFNTIIPGWYTPRALHYHIRVHLSDAASSTTYAVTTQLFISQSLTNTIATIAPYTSDKQSRTALASDMVYTSISDSSLAASLILSASGSTSAGYTSSFNLGIDTSSS